MPRLKVFRTAIGFHDAYVAVPSRKAALAAWGSDKDLFARGAAEEVTDPALAAEPLAQPGVVIRRLRGTAAEQFAALPPFPPKRAKAPAPDARPAARTSRKAAPLPPKPRRDGLDAAEAAVTAAEARQAERLRDLAEREAALARERQRIEREGAGDLRRLRRRRDEAAADFDAAMAAWRALSRAAPIR